MNYTQKIAILITILHWTRETDIKEFYTFSPNFLEFQFQHNHSFCRKNENSLMYHIVNDFIELQSIHQRLHNLNTDKK